MRLRGFREQCGGKLKDRIGTGRELSADGRRTMELGGSARGKGEADQALEEARDLRGSRPYGGVLGRG